MGPETDARANKGTTNLITCYRTGDLPEMGRCIRLVLHVDILLFELNLGCEEVWKCVTLFLSHIQWSKKSEDSTQRA